MRGWYEESLGNGRYIHYNINWAQDVAEQEMAEEMNPNSILDTFVGAMSRSIINEYLHTSTKSSNYLFFNIYRTDFGDSYIVALGIFGHFIVLDTGN
jgi:hypothetical protein